MIDKLWSAVSTSLSEKRLGNHDGTVRSVVTTADGKYAATASGDHTGKIWDLHSRKCLSTLGSKPQNLTGGGIGSGHHHIVTSIDISPNGEFAVTASYDKCVRIWKVSSGEPLAILQGHMQIINCCRWMPDGRSVLSGSTDGTLRRWSLTCNGDSDMTAFPWGGGIVLEFAFAHCAETSLQDDHADSVEFQRRTQRHRAHRPDMACALVTLVGHEGSVTACDASDAASVIASAGSDGTVRLWAAHLVTPEAGSRALIRAIPCHARSVVSCCLSPSGALVASGSLDCTVKVHRVEDGFLYCAFAIQGYGQGVAFANRDDRVAVCTGGRKIKIWDVTTGHCVGSLPGVGRPVSSFALTRDGRAVLGGEDFSVLLLARPHSLLLPDQLAVAEEFLQGRLERSASTASADSHASRPWSGWDEDLTRPLLHAFPGPGPEAPFIHDQLPPAPAQPSKLYPAQPILPAPSAPELPLSFSLYPTADPAADTAAGSSGGRAVEPALPAFTYRV